MQGRAYLYKLQLALGRSARGIQDRLAEFAAQGDTTSEAGLAALLQQSALELLRNKDSIRYAAAEARGPMSLTNAETAMNGVSLAERSRFQVERVRVADGRAARSDAPAEEGKEALELVVVTLVAATRTPLRTLPAGRPPRRAGGAAVGAGRRFAERAARPGGDLDAGRRQRFDDRDRRDDHVSRAAKPLTGEPTCPHC